MSPLPAGFVAGIPLGEGGQARAILAWQEVPGRWVVVKRGRGQARDGLRREADILTRLGGGAVPALLGQDLASSSPWICMTWIEGLPFDALPADLSMGDRRALCQQAGLAVARLHAARVIHGDLSLGNLVVRPHGEVAVLDLGMSPSASGPQSVEGTWEILAPERLQGGAPDPRWDVFALGVVALRLIGAVPPGEHTRESWRQLCASGELSRHARGRSWALSLALDPDPTARPADAAELVRLLEKEWGDPPLSLPVLEQAWHEHLDRLLAVGSDLALAAKDGRSGWRIQRERIERSLDPEPLLARLDEFRRLERRRPWIWAGAATSAVAAALAISFLVLSRPSDRPEELPTDPRQKWEVEEFDVPEEVAPDVLVFDPPPPGSMLMVDGRVARAPSDGFLRLGPGRHHVELLDSSGAAILDTQWTVPRREPPKPTKPPAAMGGRKP